MKYFGLLDAEIYLTINICIVILSLITVLQKGRSLRSLSTIMWSYLSVILSDYIPMKIRSTVDRLLSGVWLISCTVILAASAGLMRQKMMKRYSIEWIDSLDDLFEWKHMAIQSSDLSRFTYYIYDNLDYRKALDFSKRLNKISSQEFELGHVDIDYERVHSGEIAVVMYAGYLEIIKWNFILNYDMIEDVDFHISKEGIPSEPYFIQFNKLRFERDELLLLDKM